MDDASASGFYDCAELPLLYIETVYTLTPP